MGANARFPCQTRVCNVAQTNKNALARHVEMLLVQGEGPCRSKKGLISFSIHLHNVFCYCFWFKLGIGSFIEPRPPPMASPNFGNMMWKPMAASETTFTLQDAAGALHDPRIHQQVIYNIMFFVINFIMHFQFKTAVRAAFRERFDIQTVPHGTILKRLDGIYVKTSHMKKYCKMRAMTKFRVSILFSIMIFITNSIIVRTPGVGTTALVCYLQTIGLVYFAANQK